MVTWPLWVKPKFSKRIKGRVSESILRDLISAVEGERKRKKKKKRRRRRVVMATLVIYFLLDGVVMVVIIVDWEGLEEGLGDEGEEAFRT